jgi:membrane-associated protein
MEGIDWGDLFTAADTFLAAMATHHGILVYVTLFAIFFSETGLVVMAFLPGDSLLFVAGALAGNGLMNVWLLLVLITLAAVLGNTLNYAIGHWLGDKVYAGKIGWLDPKALQRTHQFYERHGGKTIVLARFIPIVRSFAPLVAGAGRMDQRMFQLYNVSGAALWVIALVGGGYLFGNIPLVKDNLSAVLILGLAAAAGPVLLAGAWKLKRRLRGVDPAV